MGTSRCRACGAGLLACLVRGWRRMGSERQSVDVMENPESSPLDLFGNHDLASIGESGMARTPPTESRRRRILIAAAATAALGAPVRIVDISASRWARKGRAGVRPARPAPFVRRPSTASQPAPQPEADHGGPAE
jgi:hypothetical protein